jgi:PAS domain S-box-containing protein
MVTGDVHARAALDAALDCVICIDEVGRITYFNKSAQRTFGYHASEAIGRELASGGGCGRAR